MARALSRALTILGRLYRPEGGQAAITNVDMDTPLQFVHDVSREAELSSVLTGNLYGSLWALAESRTHAGAGSLQGTELDPYASLQQDWGIQPITDWWIWLMGVQTYATAAGVFDQGTVSISYTNDYPGINGSNYLLVANHTDAIQSNTAVFLGYATNPVPCQLPVLIPAGGGINYRSTALAAGDMAAVYFLWAGLVGVYPPGMA